MSKERRRESRFNWPLLAVMLLGALFWVLVAVIVIRVRADWLAKQAKQAGQESGEKVAIPEAAQAPGKLVLVADYSNPENTSVIIYAVNGDWQTAVANFDACRIDGETYALPGEEIPCRNWFNEDYTHLAITYTDAGTGETHAGWVDQAGVFFDIQDAKWDWNEENRYEALGFIGEEFIYRDARTGAYHSVTGADLQDSVIENPFAGATDEFAGEDPGINYPEEKAIVRVIGIHN